MTTLLATAVLATRPADAAKTGRRPESAHVVARSARTTADKAAAQHRTRHALKAVAGKKAHPRPEKKAASLERRVPAIKGGLPNIQARGALVLDENGRELYSKMPDQERPIASISKLAAALVVVDRGLELDGLSTITRTDLDVARGGARSRLLEGMTLSNRDLLHAALMGSDNRAIPALGRAVKLSPPQLAAAMTARARAMGLTKTRFHDPTGLSIANVSTPRETIALLQAVISHPVLGPITQRVEYDAHPIRKPRITYVNTYRPAMRNHVQVLGGKTGYNDDARYCLVLAAKIDGHTCFMSFLSNEGKLTRFGDVARVADWLATRKPKDHAPPVAGSPTVDGSPRATLAVVPGYARAAASPVNLAGPMGPVGPYAAPAGPEMPLVSTEPAPITPDYTTASSPAESAAPAAPPPR